MVMETVPNLACSNANRDLSVLHNIVQCQVPAHLHC